MDYESQKQGAAVYERPLTPEEAADYLRLSKRTLLDLARRGEIPAFKVGSRWRFSKRQLARHMGIIV